MARISTRPSEQQLAKVDHLLVSPQRVGQPLQSFHLHKKHLHSMVGSGSRLPGKHNKDSGLRPQALEGQGLCVTHCCSTWVNI